MSFMKKYYFITFGLFMSFSNTSGLRDLVKESQIFVLTGGWKPGETASDQTSADIEMDYFFGEAALRSPKSMICKSDSRKHECKLMCGADNYGCIFDDCVCLGHDKPQGTHKKEDIIPPSKKDIKYLLSEFEDLITVIRRQSNNVKPPKVERPALRHHIAHFCKDLNVARQCIRTCMQVGKPAFCGKDHNCYCGHKYNQHSQDPKINVHDTYAQFRDLYTKYFGADGGDPITVNGGW